MAQPATSRLVTLSLAADRFACSERTIRRMIASGQITGYRFGKRMVRVDLDEVSAQLRPIPSAGGAA